MIKKNLPAWAIMVPSLILFAFYIWQPLISGIILSFTKTKGFNAVSFAGLQNYIDVINDASFMKALSNSFYYIICSVAIGYLLPIIIAIMVNEMIHFKSFFRVSVYFPNMVPMVATLMMWQFMMDPGRGGLFNTILSQLGIGPSGWLQDSRLTIPLIILTMTWKAAGSTVLIYIANLQGINQEMYETASLDGAGLLSRVRYVTIPYIYNLARLMLILQVIFVFQVLYEPYVMTGGGPANASVSLMLLNYRYAFNDMQSGKATAVGFMVSIVLLLLTAVYLKFSKEKDMT